MPLDHNPRSTITFFALYNSYGNFTLSNLVALLLISLSEFFLMNTFPNLHFAIMPIIGSREVESYAKKVESIVQKLSTSPEAGNIARDSDR